MSYEGAHQTRQQILDWLHVNPNNSAKAIGIGIAEGRNRVESSLRMMTARGEIVKIGHGITTVYRAIATTTISADEVIEEMREKRKKSGGKAEKARSEHGRVTKPGYYAQRGGNWQSKSEGGQGALRQAVGVASSFGMV